MDLRLQGTFTAAEAASNGMSRRELQRMLTEGKIERISWGLYRHTDEEPADNDLIEIAAKAHQPTLCLVSALARHELTDIIPPAHDVALPRGTWRPRVSTPVHWHSFDAATFDIGRDECPVDDTHSIGVYNAPRSVVDAYRLRREVGLDIASEALRRWLRHGGEPAEVMRITNSFPAAKPAVLNALRILL
jgi:hypothetical protein